MNSQKNTGSKSGQNPEKQSASVPAQTSAPASAQTLASSPSARNLICPECGQETDVLVKNVCRDCFAQKFSLFQLPLVLHARVCPQCGAHYYKSKWCDFENIEEIVTLTAQENMLFHEDAQNVTIGMHAHPRSPYIYDVLVDMEAEVEGIKLYKDAKTEVRVKREACDMCSRRAGGYFEGIIQVRGGNRMPAKEEVDRCLQIINDTMIQQLKKGDKLAFVTDSMTFKDGADVFIGSTNAGRHVCKRIIELMGGSVAESYTLAGVKDGREIFRTTFAMRLPEFKKGDVIYIDGKVIEVRNCAKRLTGINLLDSSSYFTENENLKDAKFLGNTADAENAVLVDVEENAIMVLDPVTFETVTIKKPISFNALAGSEIKVFRTPYGIFAL
ncbi:hypothetical protein MsAg5_03860 [Methanosarcinaceae archaeon Ag5]|uniref:Nmd3 N-terminal domain-containing protein n=1 Tax=Methanolapillus africanus TaxID=3028297 RepID=A0AAE4MIL6_9EURY|nr:hypothetical protein [Methanosarcinaceae archaeon Ag5]